MERCIYTCRFRWLALRSLKQPACLSQLLPPKVLRPPTYRHPFPANLNGFPLDLARSSSTLTEGRCTSILHVHHSLLVPSMVKRCLWPCHHSHQSLPRTLSCHVRRVWMRSTLRLPSSTTPVHIPRKQGWNSRSMGRSRCRCVRGRHRPRSSWATPSQSPTQQVSARWKDTTNEEAKRSERNTS